MKLYFVTLWILILTIVTSSNAQSNDSLKRAWIDINNKNYSGAQALLFKRIQSHPNEIETKFLYARALAWDGQHKKAINQIDQLLISYPKNTDFLLFKARILSWQKKNVQALNILDGIRKISPKFYDAWRLEFTLLKRQFPNNKDVVTNFYAKFAKNFPDQNILKPNFTEKQKNRFIQSTYHYESLDNSNNWNSFSFVFGNQWKKVQYIVNAETTRRFDLNDQQLGLSVLFKKASNLWLSAGTSASSQKVLFPSISLFGQIDYKNRYDILSSYKFHHKSYSNSTLGSNRLAFSKRWKNFEPKILFFITSLDYNDITLSTSAQITYYHNNHHTIRASITKGNELEYLDDSTILYDVTNLSIDGKYRIDSTWSVIFALSHHIQGTAYTKNGILSGIQFRF